MFLPQLGLKGSSQLDQINDRLQYNPIAYEFYTDANDFTDEGYQHLYDAIQYVKDAGIKNIILHHPMKFQDHHSEVVAPEKQYPDLYRFIEFTTEKLLYLADDLMILLMRAINASMMQFNTLKMLELKILFYITQWSFRIIIQK